LGELGVDGRIILKWEIVCECLQRCTRAGACLCVACRTGLNVLLHSWLCSSALGYSLLLPMFISQSTSKHCTSGVIKFPRFFPFSLSQTHVLPLGLNSSLHPAEMSHLPPIVTVQKDAYVVS